MTISLNQSDLRAALLRVVVDHRGPAVPESGTCEHWIALARKERVAPLLYQLVDSVPSDLGDDERLKVVQLQSVAMSRCVRLEHRLLVVAGLLAEHGIRVAVLKGLATAHLDYPDPSWREFGDIDLLIAPEDLVGVADLLVDHGWTLGYALPRGHEQYTHAMTFVHDYVELDLHQRLSHRALGLRMPTRELLDRALPFEVAGRELLALEPVDRLIHSAVHAVVSRGPNRRLSSMADVLVAAERHSALAVEVLDRAERWRIRPLIEQGVLDAYETARLDLHPLWTEAMRRPIRRRDRLIDRAYRGPGRRPVTEELAYLRLLTDWRDRGRYLRGYLATDPEYAAQHGRSGVRAQAGYLLSKFRSPRP